MSQVLEQRTVGQLVVERPNRARVFERFGIDYCCGGKKPLADACREKKLDLPAVLEAITQADQTPQKRDIDWSTASMSHLADHITHHYHDRLRQELPRLEFLTQKVAAVHGQNHPELLELFQVFGTFKNELLEHMEVEEQMLFPRFKHLEDAAAPAGSLETPISVLLKEHDDAGAALETMRRLTGGYVAPPDACNTYRAMLEGLAEMETEMHQHVHTENNILFPKALAAEAKGTAS